MNRLKDISRQGGYPICAETLEVLSENSEMLNELLKSVQMKPKTAALFSNGKYMLACDNGNRIVKVGTRQTYDLDSAKVVISTTDNDVSDSLGNTYGNVFVTETADIVSTTSDDEKWTFVDLRDIIEARMWEDLLPAFSAGMSGSTCNTGFKDGAPGLLNTGNVLKTNGNRMRIKLDIELSFKGSDNSVIRIPFPYLTGDQKYPLAGAVIDNVSTLNTYPIFAYIANGELVIMAGRWLKDSGLSITGRPVTMWSVLHINTEILL